MKTVLIDPEMFMLQKGDIEKNIDFFQKIIDLNKDGKLSIGLYDEVINKMMVREIHPFPINIQELQDKKLKEKLLLLNESFVTTIMCNFKKVDIDSCSGSQEFVTDREDLENSVDYFAFFSMLLSECYCSEHLSENVLVGEKKTGLCEGDTVNISCDCEKIFSKEYKWILPDDLLDNKQKAEQKIRKIIHSIQNLFIVSPIVTRADHHNRVQNEKFSCYEELKSKNKKVLNYLRYFGLQRIVFENFSPDESREVGSIKLVKIKECDNCDIVSGWLYGCIGFKILIEMYFPKTIGKLLYTYFDTEITRKSVEELKCSLGI